jgi:hypothetical protein
MTGLNSARARDERDKIRVALYGPGGYGGHALLDDDAARRLRDELNTCLTGRAAAAMAARWEGSQ